MKYAIAAWCAFLAYFALTTAPTLVVDHDFGTGWGWVLVPFSIAGAWGAGAGIGTLQALIRRTS